MVRDGITDELFFPGHIFKILPVFVAENSFVY